MKLLALLVKKPRKVHGGSLRHSLTYTSAKDEHPLGAARLARAIMKLLAYLGKNLRKTVGFASRLISRCAFAMELDTS